MAEKKAECGMRGYRAVMRYSDIVEHVSRVSSHDEDKRISELLLEDRMTWRIMRELNGRKGYDALWDELDGDIQDEIFEAVKEVVISELETLS